MSKNRHRVVVSAPPLGAKTYYWSVSGTFPNYIFIDASGKYQQADVLYDESFGKIYDSSYKDCYRNRDCYHSYLDFNGILGVEGLPGFSTTVNMSSSYPTRINSYGSTKTSYHIAGEGLPQTSGWSYVVYCNTENQEIIESYYQGVHCSTISYELVSFVLPKTITSSFTCYYDYNVVYTSTWKKTHAVTDTHLRKSASVTPIYIGVYTGSSLPTHSDLDFIFSSLYETRILNHYVPDTLTDDIFDKLTIPDVNNVENLKDFKQIRTALMPIIRLLRKRSWKTLAEFYLWYKYTYLTTELDLEAYYKFFLKWQQDTAHKSDVKRIHLHYKPVIGFNGDEDTQYTIITDTYNCGILKALGLDLNLSNTWDALPFSFVVDWFVNLGDVLSSLDHNTTVASLTIRTVISTTKRQVRYQPLTSHCCDAVCSAITYQRTINDKLPIGRISFSLKNPLNHIGEGVALILANKT